MSYIAHIRASDGKIQTVKEHLLGVMTLAESFGESIGIKHISGLAGLLHDLGKYSEEFREYILAAVNNPDEAPRRGSVDHSTAGGKLLYDFFHSDLSNPYKVILAEIVGNAIISHHSYLQDFLSPELESNYLKRVKDKDIPGFNTTVNLFFEHVMDEQEFHLYVEKAVYELEAYLPKKRIEEELMFLSKFIFSSLIDADRTNTRLFEENQLVENKNDHQDLFETYYSRLMDKIKTFDSNPGSNHPINQLRKEMSAQCDLFAERPSGIYTLSIPTGGGKTLASFRYAIKHAKLYRKKRIVYVIPFTTIIEQNAEEIRSITRDPSNLLEHHSNIVEDLDENDELLDGGMSTLQKLKLAKDNWDSPIIFTTMVQFLNVFYAKGSRNIRRLHNLSETVIIFDEVQKVPTACVSLFNQALNYLKTHAKSSIVLCTATQPALEYVEHKLEISADQEMIPELDYIFESFKRVNIIDKSTRESFNTEKLTGFIIEKMNEINSILVVLNTKTVVKDLYNSLKEQLDSIPVFHLSTTMCAAHRKEILTQVRKHLALGEKIICVSTQLIEAGVDVSFECVIRSLAGLDSIAQAAGRCNRHGEKPKQRVYLIDHEGENLKHLNEIRLGKEISKKILVDLARNPNEYGGNILSKQAMDKYFREFYSELKSNLNYSIPKLNTNMTDLLTVSRNQNTYRHAYFHKNDKRDIPLFLVNSYKTAAENFKVIDQMTTSVIVPFGEGKEIIADFNGSERIEDLSLLLRRSQQYTINLFEHEKRKLTQNQGLISLMEGKVLALADSAYNQEYGLNLENDNDLSFSFI
ncbi:CRISPR-associated helicase Cas3' [Bacillus sp. REN3]|uniref:CRISPR-associated helicase Cas3' n=1 Tax=Bacillus sp. REN3 TaxID=2802440 RepID=UPI001AEE0A6F|nr:CRISPR-associated helicase Cas3' [Bacillus sp. REN3]